jgi:tetratricopeptide (TPR) repeat protein
MVLILVSTTLILFGGRGGELPESGVEWDAQVTGQSAVTDVDVVGTGQVQPLSELPRVEVGAHGSPTSDPLPEEPPATVVAAATPPAAAPVRKDQAVPSQVSGDLPGTVSAGPRQQPSSRELTGISRRYDDFECSRIQQRFGRRVPAAATILEVDGHRLAVGNIAGLSASPSPYLFLPRGEHLVNWREGERTIDVRIEEDLATVYADMRAFFAVGGQVRSDELFSRGARTMDVHRAPFLLNFSGAAYAARDEWEAAERKFRRALQVNPLFSPAHLNLAYCLARRNERDEAVRELYLAHAFNPGNVFGIHAGLIQLGRELGVTAEQLEDPPWVEYRADIYIVAEPISEEDRRLTAILTAAARYAVREEDRGKVMNNLAVHFADSGRPELALNYFRSALEAFKLAGSDRFELARHVLAQMAATCRRAGYVEAEEYAQMQHAVLP